MNKNMVSLLGCLPPLLPPEEIKDKCRGKFNISIDKGAIIKKQFIKMYSLDFKPNTCVKPCIQRIYKTKLIYSLPTDTPGIRIVFGESMKVLHSA